MSQPILARRGFLGGLIALVAAPAIVRATSIMPIKPIRPDYLWVAREALENAIRTDIDIPIMLRYGDMFMMTSYDADRLQLKALSPKEVFRDGNAEWRFPRIEYPPGAEPPQSWE